MLVLVTGGTGLLGNNIVRQLHELGHQCLALVRQPPHRDVFAGVDVETVKGELGDTRAVDEAVGRADAVIHSAGLIHIGWRHLDESMRVNRDGSANVARAARRHGRRLVHVGTVDTFGVASPGQSLDESHPVPAPGSRGGKVACSYVLSKRAGAEEVRREVERGLDATIVHPGFMLGPWDWKPSSGRMAVEVGRAWRPICPSGGCSVCDVRDVANATINALQTPESRGQEFILAGENWSYRRLWGEIARRMGRRGPLARLGPTLRFAVGRAADAVTKWTGNESDLNSAALAISSQFHYYSSRRAEAALDYRRRPIGETLNDAVAWLRERHLP